MIRAITFDLDDTLWPVAPVIAAAEQAVHEWFLANAPAVAERFDVAALRALREQTGREHPELAHDLSGLRRLSLEKACQRCGVDESLAEAAFSAFFAARNRVQPYPDVGRCLSSLAHRHPLAALTNGNACLHLTGFEHYFRFSISAIEAGAAKPDPRMFLHAARRLELAPAEILHVGDDPERDVSGALAAGFHSVLLDRDGAHTGFSEAPVIRSLDELIMRKDSLL